ncbi:large ribosomal subunit protein cL37 alpha isoform X1 [Magnolia sinica]|uniref:large ribosomal subunit protein cL37 alpha isoform X1 n=1 Tax=Magnolia sinica TaxID=86752 RepID=UPI00265A6ABC|nr:large ribosomal subunit protein cL37 alpha isoform X1 [Magnolia sinica]
MALHLLSPLSIFSPSSSSSSTSLSLAISPHPSCFWISHWLVVSRLPRKNLNLQPRSSDGVRFHTPIASRERLAVIVRASPDVDGKDSESKETPAEASGEIVSIENLPLESKQQMMLEQKLRMKLAKKIRLRRKRLVRKRRMRKKGRWPPSKMKKNKNV